MKTAATVIGRLTGIAGLIQIVLGTLFWTGHAQNLIPQHMLIGALFVLLLWTLCGMGVAARLPWPGIAFAFGWGLLLPVFGLMQMQLFPGPGHWVVRLVHLLMGLVAMRESGLLSARLAGTPTRSRPAPVEPIASARGGNK